MKLDRRARVRVAVLGGLAKALLASRVARAALLSRRRAELAAGLDSDLAALAVMDSITGDSRVEGHTAASARARTRTSIAIADAPAAHLRVAARPLTVAGAAGPLAARLYVPDGIAAAAPSPAVVFFHGGGWVTGDLDTHDGLCRRLAARGRVRVIAVDYRLAPEHRYPAAAHDAIAAFRDLVRRAGELGLDPRRIGVAGDSAGGNLSAVIALALRGAPDAPALQALLYPATDLTCSHRSHTTMRDAFVLDARAIAWYRGHYLGADPPAARLREPMLSPLHAPDVAGVAPAYVVTAGFDPLHDEAIAYGERLRAAGVDVELHDEPSLVHGFLLLTALSPACARATDAVCVRIGALLRRERSDQS